jgi:hypothetical protein
VEFHEVRNVTSRPQAPIREVDPTIDQYGWSYAISDEILDGPAAWRNALSLLPEDELDLPNTPKNVVEDYCNVAAGTNALPRFDAGWLVVREDTTVLVGSDELNSPTIALDPGVAPKPTYVTIVPDPAPNGSAGSIAKSRNGGPRTTQNINAPKPISTTPAGSGHVSPAGAPGRSQNGESKATNDDNGRTGSQSQSEGIRKSPQSVKGAGRVVPEESEGKLGEHGDGATGSGRPLTIPGKSSGMKPGSPNPFVSKTSNQDDRGDGDAVDVSNEDGNEHPSALYPTVSKPHSSSQPSMPATGQSEEEGVATNRHGFGWVVWVSMGILWTSFLTA